MLRASLKYQVLLAFAGATVVIAFVSGTLVERFETQYLRTSFAAQSEATFNAVLASALEAMIIEDQPVLASIAERMQADDKEIISIQISSESGRRLVQLGDAKAFDDVTSARLSRDVTFAGEAFGNITVTWDLTARLAGIQKHARLIAFFIACALLVLMLIMLWGIQVFVLRPVAHLNRILSAYSEGNLERRVELSAIASEELQRLGHSVNVLGEALILRKAREAELKEAKLAAESANLAKSQFLANMSHELRTPLNAILGFSEMMAQQVFGALGHRKYREYASDVHNSANHLLQLIGDVLDLAKIEAGKIKLEEEQIDLADQTRRVIRLLDSEAKAASVEVHFELLNPLPAMLGDPLRIRQVLLNLLSNAIKFTARGGKVTVIMDFDPLSGFLVSVADSGIGIQEEDLNRILEPFVQAESSYSKRHGGVGLGLPLTKALVELHDGWLELDSQPKSGTTVTLHFPAARALRKDAVANGGSPHLSVVRH